MACGINFGVGLEDLSVLPNHIGNALGVLIPGRFTRSISQSYIPISVTQQGEGEMELLRKGGVFFYRVKADPKNRHIFRIILKDSITESFAFVGSAGCVRLGVKPKDHLSPEKFVQGHLFPFMGLYLEIGRFFSG